MSTYYAYQDVKIAIVHRLFQLDGWKVYGWSPDKSDAYTDYYDPEYWDGIAEKNGYRLVIDHSREAKERRYTVRTSAQAALDAKTAEKLEKLEALTRERGATAGEEAAAQKAIEAIRAKMAEAEENAVTVKEIVEPGHLANPPRCNWHIEKNGIIIDKGTGLLKFSSVLDITEERYLKDWQEFNNLSASEWKAKEAAEYTDRWSYSEKQAKQAAEEAYKTMAGKVKLLEQFNILINRFNTICGGMMGNTDNFYTYEEITVTEYKTEIKPKETESGSMKEGQHFVVKSHGFNHGVCAGYVYVIHERENTKGGKYYYAVRMNGKLTKELTGNANPANFWGYFTSDNETSRFLKWIEKGSLAFCDLEEVKTPYEVKKVVKKKITAEKAEEPETTEEPATAEEAAPEADTAATAEQEATEAAADPEQVTEHADAETVTEDAEPATEKPTTEAEPEPAEKEKASEGKPAAPGFNYADLARAYFTGKTVKSSKPKPEKKEEPAQTTTEPKPAKAPEPVSEAEIKPEPEKPYVYGYQKNNNSNGIFTDSDIRNLVNGFQVAIENPRYTWETCCYFCAGYSAHVNLLYKAPAHKDGENRIIPTPGKNAEYAGFLVNGSLYTNRKAINSKLREDINRKLLELVPDLHSATISAANVSEYEKKEIADCKRWENHYKKEARTFFFDGKKPDIFLYENHYDFDLDLLIEYVQFPDRVIEREALAFLCNKAAHICKEWIRYSAVSAEYNAIVSDPGREEHTLLKISKSVKDEKTVRIKLENGNTVKVEADSVKRLPFCGYISSWYVSASDRKNINSDKIEVSDIRAIYHGGRILYQAA